MVERKRYTIKFLQPANVYWGGYVCLSNPNEITKSFAPYKISSGDLDSLSVYLLIKFVEDSVE